MLNILVMPLVRMTLLLIAGSMDESTLLAFTPGTQTREIFRDMFPPDSGVDYDSEQWLELDASQCDATHNLGDFIFIGALLKMTIPRATALRRALLSYHTFLPAGGRCLFFLFLLWHFFPTKRDAACLKVMTSQRFPPARKYGPP